MCFALILFPFSASTSSSSGANPCVPPQDVHGGSPFLGPWALCFLGVFFTKNLLAHWREFHLMCPIHALYIYLQLMCSTFAQADRWPLAIRREDIPQDCDRTGFCSSTGISASLGDVIHVICTHMNKGHEIVQANPYHIFGVHESSFPVAHPGYQVLTDIMFRLGLIANALTQCSS